MKKLVKLSAAGLIFISMAFLLPGCGFKDIDKRLFVVSIGIDPAKNENKKFLISLKFAVPNVEGVSNESFILSEESETIAEAVRVMKTKVDKEIDFSHAKVILYHEDILKEDIEPNLYYWFVRRRDVQEMSWVAIGKPSALEVLKVKPKSERMPSNSLFLALGKDGTETPYIITEYLFDLKRRFSEKGLDPLMPIIEANKDLLEINTVGLLNKKELKLSLPPRQTMILNFLLNEEPKSAIKIEQGDKTFVIDTQQVKTKYKIVTKNQKEPYIKVDFRLKGRIEEALFSVRNDELRQYEKLASSYAKKEIHKVLLKLQKANVDPVGFGLRYRGRHFEKDDWETWQRLYPDIKFKVNVEVKLTDTGLVE